MPEEVNLILSLGADFVCVFVSSGCNGGGMEGICHVGF